MPSNLTEQQISSQIRKLHGEIQVDFESGLIKAIQIGELLSDKKATLRKGEWILWIEAAKLGFKEDQAQRYMRLYENRKLLKEHPRKSINDAIAAIKTPRTMPIQDRSPSPDSKPVTSKKTGKSSYDLSPEERAKRDIEEAEEEAAKEEGAKVVELPVDNTGVRITVEALPYWQRKQEVQDFLTAISRLRSLLKEREEDGDRLFEFVAPHVREGLASAYTSMTNAMPHAVCLECEGHPSLNKCAFCHGTGLISKYAYEVQSNQDKRRIREKAHARRA